MLVSLEGGKGAGVLDAGADGHLPGQGALLGPGGFSRREPSSPARSCWRQRHPAAGAGGGAAGHDVRRRGTAEQARRVSGGDVSTALNMLLG